MNDHTASDDLVCRNCRHFRQHYIQLGRRYVTTNCGHCVYPRLKSRRPDDSCARWALRETKQS